MLPVPRACVLRATIGKRFSWQAWRKTDESPGSRVDARLTSPGCSATIRIVGEATSNDVDPRPIWEWGFIERVSTGLLLKQLGEEAEAAEYLALAELWAATDD